MMSGNAIAVLNPPRTDDVTIGKDDEAAAAGEELHPRLAGATFAPVDDSAKDSGVDQGIVIQTVAQGSPAARSGLRQGDIISDVRDGEAVRISIRGPASLYDGLQASLGAFAADLHFEEAPGFDLTVAIDDAVFETRLSEWSAALSQVLT